MAILWGINIVYIINVLCISSQLKILLDQVDEAVGDFDECILLRPDSALAQAQKCFALVSNQLQKRRKSCFPDVCVKSLNSI